MIAAVYCHIFSLVKRAEVFSVNEESEVHKCIEAGASFIMSDEPQLVVSLVHKEQLR